MKNKVYTLGFIMKQMNYPCRDRSFRLVTRECECEYDASLHYWRLRFRLDKGSIWFLSVFIKEDGTVEKYSLDVELTRDSHYEFQEEQKIREKLYIPGDENRYFHEILIRYADEKGGKSLESLIKPYVTTQWHYD